VIPFRKHSNDINVQKEKKAEISKKLKGEA